jgi:hypothetical protein
MSKPKTPAREANDVAQISNLPYRRFPIGSALNGSGARELPDAPQVGNLRYGRLEICATKPGPARPLLQTSIRSLDFLR